MPLEEKLVEAWKDFRARTLAGGCGRGVVRISSDSMFVSFVVVYLVVTRWFSGVVVDSIINESKAGREVGTSSDFSKGCPFV